MSEMDDTKRRGLAVELWQQAYQCQRGGDLDQAIAMYRRSIDAWPTAEAHTFLGWALSFWGRLTEATAECLRAIDIDPEFGNPYNDIGVYLLEQGKLDEAISWLERAKTARRYEPRHFPFLNLGRIYVQQGRWWEALRELREAQRLAPDDPQARRALHAVMARLN
jgi:tetratricopeptide (TPR) repeat protein